MYQNIHSEQQTSAAPQIKRTDHDQFENPPGHHGTKQNFVWFSYEREIVSSIRLGLEHTNQIIQAQY